MKRFICDLKKEFHGYNGKKLVSDLMAGITVAAVALPLALAFGVSSGATAASGLLTAIISGLIIAALGGAFYQISGPTGAMAAILMSIVATYGMGGVFCATVMAGIMLVLCGILHIGKLTAFIPMPVITGFTSGIAITIALGQLDNFLGVTSSGSSALEKVASYFAVGITPNITAVIIGLAVILFMVFYPKKLNAIVPSSLVSIILATAASMIFSLPVDTVGEIPKTIFLDQRLSLSDFKLDNIKTLISPAISIAALGMVESLLCGASAGRMTGVKLNADRELIAQGIGNIAAPFFGGIPATAAIARTSVAIKSGAQTRLCGIFHSLFILASMLLLGPIMAKIPLSALSGVLLVTSWRMNEWETIKYIFSHKFKGGMVKFLVTMIATIVFDLTVAIIIGVVIALVLTDAKLSKLDINTSDSDGEETTVHICGAMIFANTESIEEMLDTLSQKKNVTFCLDGVSLIDISGAKEFLSLCEQLHDRGVAIKIDGAVDSVSKMLDRSGIASLLDAWTD